MRQAIIFGLLFTYCIFISIYLLYLWSQSVTISSIKKSYDSVQAAIEEANTRKESIEQINEKLKRNSETYIELIEKNENSYNDILEQLKKKKEELEQLTDSINSATTNYSNLDEEYKQKKEKLENECAALAQKQSGLESNIKDISQKLAAAKAAQLREREIEEKEEFYKLTISEQDLADVKRLLELRFSFRNTNLMSKLVWSEYFLKITNQLCTRILKDKTVIGIYKITNLVTKQSYIGQSVDIASRWKQHIKCGLGIDASHTNMLYNSMQKYGVWNFAFELIEQCSKEQLNEREKFYISLYQTDKFGYNMTQGGS